MWAANCPVTRTGMIQAMTREIGGGKGGEIHLAERTGLSAELTAWTVETRVTSGTSARAKTKQLAPELQSA